MKRKTMMAVGMILLLVSGVFVYKDQSKRSHESVKNEIRKTEKSMQEIETETTVQSSESPASSEEKPNEGSSDHEEIKAANAAFITAFYTKNTEERSRKLRPLVTDLVYESYGELENDLETNEAIHVEQTESFYGDDPTVSGKIMNFIPVTHGLDTSTILLKTTVKKLEGEWLISELEFGFIPSENGK